MCQRDECKGLIVVELLLLAGEAIFVDLEWAGCDGLEVERAFFDNRDLHMQSPEKYLEELVTSCAQQVVGL
jgi:hypothetical protein